MRRRIEILKAENQRLRDRLRATLRVVEILALRRDHEELAEGEFEQRRVLPDGRLLRVSVQGQRVHRRRAS